MRIERVFWQIALVVCISCSSLFSAEALPQTVSAGAAQEGLILYVSTDGNDSWSGALAHPNAARTDGPFASIAGARDAIRKLKSKNTLTQPVSVYVHGGTYTLAEPLVFTDADSGTEKTPITYSAYQNEVPVLSGGRAISGWKKSKRGELWEAEASEVKEGKWYFHQLFVNGGRRQRARTPNSGFFHVDGKVLMKPAKFKFRNGDIKPAYAEDKDVDVVVPQAWTIMRYHIADFNAADSSVTLSGKNTPWVDEKDARFWIENSLDALDSPGEWYLDRRSGKLYYWPMPGEDMAHAEVIAPVLAQLVRFRGDVWGSDQLGDSSYGHEPVHDIRLRGFTFSYADWSMPRNGYIDYQGGVDLRGALEATAATSIIIENSIFKHLGQFAIELGKACRGFRIVGNELSDLGGGGVKIGEPKDPNSDDEVTSGNIISDNRIHDVGVVDPGADAVWIGESSGNTIAHNEIYNTYHSGIALGWTWGYLPTAAYANVIEFNQIHDIGLAMMGDLGCVYTLGVQPGTVIRNNVCHDVTRSDTSYGGWGIYADEGSSKILIENNLIYRTQDAAFHQHYGQNNIIRNNIFALGKNSQLRRTDDEAAHSFDFEHNIVYWSEGSLLDEAWKDNNFHFDNNLYFYAVAGGDSAIKFGDLSFEEWQKRGQDVHSLIADPLFVDPAKGNFSLRPDSPALKIGFLPFDLSGVGPRVKGTL